jgi:hypothetical protein
MLEITREELERHLLAELHILGAVDLSHPSASQGRNDAEPIGDQRAGSEPAARAAADV